MLSREAMTDLGMVAMGINNAAMVRQILAGATPSSGGVVAEGQLTMDLMASHNQGYPSKQVSASILMTPSLASPFMFTSACPPNKNSFEC